MIRIRKPARAPKILTTKGTEQTQQDCAAYDLHPSDYHSRSKKFKFKSQIYGAKSVKNALLKAQYKKCCYCESKFRHTSYGAVEHFRPKGAVKQKQGQRQKYPGYYWLAYDWDNLLVSCQQCNSSYKGNLFPLAVQKRRAQSHHDGITEEQPLFINPAQEDPRGHLHFHGEVVIGDTDKGRQTIQDLGLMREDLRNERLSHLSILKTFRDGLEAYRKLAESGNDVTNLVKEAKQRILHYGSRTAALSPEAEYSAMAQDFLDSNSSSTGNE